MAWQAAHRNAQNKSCSNPRSAPSLLPRLILPGCSSDEAAWKCRSLAISLVLSQDGLRTWPLLFLELLHRDDHLNFPKMV